MKHAAFVLLAGCSAASAQLQNGGFQTGSFPPWIVTNTPAGVSGLTAVTAYDIDGPGPLPSSLAARFMVGRSSPGTSAEGIILSQIVQVLAGDYRLSVNWSVYPQVNVYNASGGLFELMVDGVVIDQVQAPVTVQNQPTYGTLGRIYQLPATRDYTIAIRITRTTTFGEEVLQYIDNVSLMPACYPNCDHSTTEPLLTGNDFQCFINWYASGTSYANCDGSTGTPALTANDFQCFLNKFVAGCS